MISKNTLIPYTTLFRSAEKEQIAKNILTNADSLIPSEYSKNEVIKTESLPKDVLKQLSDTLFDKMKLETLVLINVDNNEATFIIKSNGNIHAGNLMKELMKELNGRGGGRDTSAQGGIKDFNNIDEVVNKTKEFL